MTDGYGGGSDKESGWTAVLSVDRQYMVM